MRSAKFILKRLKSEELHRSARCLFLKALLRERSAAAATSGRLQKMQRASATCEINHFKVQTQMHEQKTTHLCYVCLLYTAVKWGPQSSRLLSRLQWSSMTFKIMPVCRLKDGGTNDNDKGTPLLWTARSPSHQESETQRGKRDGQEETSRARLRENEMQH